MGALIFTIPLTIIFWPIMILSIPEMLLFGSLSMPELIQDLIHIPELVKLVFTEFIPGTIIHIINNMF